jgi:hypothetical protein
MGDANRFRLVFGRSYQWFELRRIEQHPQDLHVELGGPLRRDPTADEQDQAPEQAVKQVENACSGNECDKKQPPLGTNSRQRTVQ